MHLDLAITTIDQPESIRNENRKVYYFHKYKYAFDRTPSASSNQQKRSTNERKTKKQFLLLLKVLKY